MDGKIILEPIKKDVIDRLHGILEGTDVLKELEEEHHREVEHDKNFSA